MHSFAEAGYGQVRRETITPERVEQKLLLSIAADIESASLDSPQGYQRMAYALQRNTELWTTFASDLMHAENQYPADLKTSLLKLAAYSITAAPKVLSGEEDRETLCAINRNLAKGLDNIANAS